MCYGMSAIACYDSHTLYAQLLEAAGRCHCGTSPALSNPLTFSHPPYNLPARVCFCSSPLGSLLVPAAGPTIAADVRPHAPTPVGHSALSFEIAFQVPAASVTLYIYIRPVAVSLLLHLKAISLRASSLIMQTWGRSHCEKLLHREFSMTPVDLLLVA